jgi:hypothetical protein
MLNLDLECIMDGGEVGRKNGCMLNLYKEQVSLTKLRHATGK